MLTARQLYFAAYQDHIHVFQPKKAPQILPPPSVVLHLKPTKVGKVIGGAIDRSFPHQVNNLMVGNLGDLEVLFFALDDGDVGAYYTHTIARYITANGEQRQGASGGPSPRLPLPKQFFHENVGMSAWGLAIHEQSRLLAVGSNRHEVTVFAFAINRKPAPADPSARDDHSPLVWSGQTALELEKHFQSRTRTWRIILPTGQEGHNIPSIAFAEDEAGYAESVVAVDINGFTWILDIWKIGSFPIQMPPVGSRGVGGQRYGSL
jgi:CRT10